MKVTVNCPELPFLEDTLRRYAMNVLRVQALISLYRSAYPKRRGRKPSHHADVLRAAVVFAHANLEDFLRSIAQHYLPFSTPDILKGIPLAGMGERIHNEKFSLGDLSAFRDLSVDALIDQSIRDHLARRTFNNVQQVEQVIHQCGFCSEPIRSCFPLLEIMLKRRHQIVHRADRPGSDETGCAHAAPLFPKTVQQWVENCTELVGRIIDVMRAREQGKGSEGFKKASDGTPPKADTQC